MNLRLNRPRARRAFTLVELLVVIGIIALLISILLPALSKARESANKTVCLSGLRSLGQTIHLYADEYKGKVVLGYANSKHAGYMVYQNGYEVFGAYYQAGYLTGPKAFYCPSKLDVRWKFSQPENPWPPPGPNGALTRMGMTLRPTMEFGAKVNGKYMGTIPVSYSIPAKTSTNDAPQFRSGYPTLSNFRKQAIAAEMFGEPSNTAAYVDPRITNHKDVINVLFDDGSANPVDIQKIDPIDKESIYTLLGKIAALKAVPSGAKMNDWYLNENSTPHRGIWYKFDQTRY